MANIPTILALASSNDGSVAITDTSFSSKTFPSIKPAIIFNLSLDLENFVKIFAVEIGSDEIAAAVGPIKYFSKSNDKLKIIAGFMDGKVLNEKEVSVIATLPSLDEARAKIVGILASPAQKLVSILLAPGSKIANLARAKSLKN